MLHTIRLDCEESFAIRKHLFDLLYPFTKLNEEVNNISLGILTDFANANYEISDGTLYVVATRSSKSMNISKKQLTIVEFEELEFNEVESYIRLHPVYPVMLSVPMPESTIPNFVDLLLSYPTQPTLIQGARESVALFAEMYQAALLKKFPTKKYEIKSVMKQGIFVVTKETFLGANVPTIQQVLATFDNLELLERWHTEFLKVLQQDHDIPALRSHLLQALEKKTIHMCIDDGEYVATIGVVNLGENGIRTNRAYIAPNSRSKSYGARVLNTVCKNAFSSNRKYALAIIKDDNNRARVIHEKLGYKLKGYWDLVSVNELQNKSKL